MGAIAEAFAAYAQPLLNETDGSPEQMQRAFTISQLCYNLALMPEDRRERVIDAMQETLAMDDQDFAEFKRIVIWPMVRRHEEMFPRMHGKHRTSPWQPRSSLTLATEEAVPEKAARRGAHPEVGPYAPCPCLSGRKYKFCCGKRGG